MWEALANCGRKRNFAKFGASYLRDLFVSDVAFLETRLDQGRIEPLALFFPVSSLGRT